MSDNKPEQNVQATTSNTTSNTDETLKITNSKPVKIKDPKRVAAGKRLAAISKAAKEKKARERFETEGEKDDNNNAGNFGYIAGIVSMVIAMGCLYYSYKKDSREEPMFEPSTPIEIKTKKTTTTKK